MYRINLHPRPFKIFTLTLDFTSHCVHLPVLYNVVCMNLMLVIPHCFDLFYTLPFYTKRLLSCSWNYQTVVLPPVSTCKKKMHALNEIFENCKCKSFILFFQIIYLFVRLASLEQVIKSNLLSFLLK